MTDTVYKINAGAVIGSEVFSDASKDELRVLVYLMVREGKVLPRVEEIASALGIKAARVKSAITLFTEGGILTECCADTPEVTLEFSEVREEGLDEERSVDAAREIRDKALAELIADIASLLDRPTLNTQEIKHITSMTSQLALSTEYIITLAAHMAESGRLTPKRLADTAARLVSRDIDNMEALGKYMEDSKRHTSAEWELRSLLGIWGRTLSKSEEGYFRRWTDELGYSTEIIGEAYDIAVMNTQKASLPYMNKLLSAWHEAGCKTLSDITAHVEAEHAKKPARKTASPKKKEKTAETPSFADYSSEDALMRALERSYSTDD